MGGEIQKTLLSKGEYAALKGRGPSAVSNWITEGRISAEAIVGTGARAKIWVEQADRDLSRRLDLGQQLAQDKPITGDAPGAPPPTAAPPPAVDEFTGRIKAARAEAEERKNRIAAREELIDNGRLVPADQVRAEMGKLAQRIEDRNAGLLADFAAGLAEKFSIDQRDVLHLLRAIRTQKRREWAEVIKAELEATPAIAEVEIAA